MKYTLIIAAGLVAGILCGTHTQADTYRRVSCWLQNGVKIEQEDGVEEPTVENGVVTFVRPATGERVYLHGFACRWY